jgi:hypothetical protein
MGMTARASWVSDMVQDFLVPDSDAPRDRGML